MYFRLTMRPPKQMKIYPRCFQREKKRQINNEVYFFTQIMNNAFLKTFYFPYKIMNWHDSELL